MTAQLQARDDAYGVEWLGHNLPERWPQASIQAVYVRVRNVGSRTWLSSHPQGHCVDLVMRVDDVIRHMVRMPHDVPPGQAVTLSITHTVPPRLLFGSPRQRIALNLVEQKVTWFDDQGVSPLVREIEVDPVESTEAAGLMQIGGQIASAFYLPTQGVTRARDGRPYPLFARQAAGSRIGDADGNAWIDYVMGWGSALLGYANPEIRCAVQEALACGAIISLPAALELEVAALLCEMIPCAQKVLFGKNGSDVCTAAVRIARVHTGRPIILFSGYHGWQEPFANAFEPALGHGEHGPAALRFAMGDQAAVDALFRTHGDRVAAVMVEPAAQVEGVDGPVRNADGAFLAELRERCHAQGALLIFDEIMTGFRHPGGSVQSATGVVPDLACFGKALSALMPLSALVGRHDLISKVGSIFYHPTFKGDVYAFAAAKAALGIYRRQDVPRQVAAYGEQLRAAVNDCSRAAGVDGELIGPPFRMVYRFAEPDSDRRTLMRTLLQQELLKRGVLPFRGFLLPSAAHDERDLRQTIDAFQAGLSVVRQAERQDSFERVLEIPPIV